MTADNPAPRDVARVGFWASLGTGVLAIAWFAAFVVQLAILPQGWNGIEGFAARFTRLELLNLIPALPLGWAYVLMLVALHHAVPEERRVWTLSALSLGIAYATMESINYLIQIVAVAPNLMAGETEGLHLWAGANPASVFWALALAYAVQALSLWLVAPAFPDHADRWVRRWCIVVGLSAPLQFGYGLLGLGLVMGAPGIVLWVIGVPAVAFLLAARFRAMQRLAATLAGVAEGAVR